MKSTNFAKSVLAATAIVSLANVAAPKAEAQLNVTVTNTGAFTSTANTNYTAYQPSTIQYNASQGQNNNFAVGANTSFGTSSSASSTPDYSVATSSVLESATAGTLLKNQIGSSGASQQTSSWAAAAGTYASSYMSERVQAAEKDAYNSTTGQWSVRLDNGTTAQYSSKAGWENAYKSTTAYKDSYTSAFNSAYSTYSGSGSSSTKEAVGTISGSFASTTGGSTALSTSGSASLSQSSATKLYVAETANNSTTYREATSDEIKTGKLGGSGSTIANFYTGSTATNASNSTSTTTYSVATSDQMRSAAVAAASVNNSTTSTNQVVVTGIGSDAQFASGQNSKFNVAINSNLGKVNGDTTANTASTVMDGLTNVIATNNKLILMQGEGAISSSATANGSANGSFGTNSTATSNQATYTSLFYQAF